ncbi:MAG: glycosyltransferase [Anaerolineaceae bacterium]|nr:glycosyltransferase [Anaerolineaceae bacterium]
MKTRILFLNHDLGPGGAEKSLVNLVNGLDKEVFEVSLRVLFNWGPNRKNLSEKVQYSAWIDRDIPANSHWMKLWTPEQLWKKIVPDGFDIVVSFLEGPCARVIGGCPENGPKTAAWIHTPILSEKKFTEGFRSRAEAERCYANTDAMVFVSKDVMNAFLHFFTPKNSRILYNIYDSEKIRTLAADQALSVSMDPGQMNWCGMGKLVPLKGWMRMLSIQKRLQTEGINAHFYLIGDGPQRNELKQKAAELDISDSVTFTGYLNDPYACLSRCELYVNASEREGFSTAAVESLLVGTPVCAVNVGGMKEILGENNEYGIVTENNDEALYQAVRKFLTDPLLRQHYQNRAAERGRIFDREQSIRKTEEFLLSLS